MLNRFLFTLLFFALSTSGWAEERFLLAAFNQILEINRQGSVVKKHHVPNTFGIYEAWKMPDGGLVFAHKKGLMRMNTQGEVVMSYQVNEESVSCDVINGGKSFALMDNSVPSIKEIDANGKLIKETPLPNLIKNVHGRYRSIRKVKGGNAFWACQLSSSTVIKVAAGSGDVLAKLELKSHGAIHLFGITDLDKGGVLVSIGKGAGKPKFIFHCDRNLNIIEKISNEDVRVQGIYFLGTQKLDNGNILLACGDYHLKDISEGKDLLVEIDDNNKIVWRLTRDQLVNQIDGFVDKRTSIEEMRITNVHYFNSNDLSQSLLVKK